MWTLNLNCTVLYSTVQWEKRAKASKLIHFLIFGFFKVVLELGPPTPLWWRGPKSGPHSLKLARNPLFGPI